MSRKRGSYYRPMNGRRLRRHLWRLLVPGLSAGCSAGAGYGWRALRVQW